MEFKFWRKTKPVKRQEPAKVYGYEMIRIGTCYLCMSTIKTKMHVEYLNKEKTSYKLLDQIWGTNEYMLCEKCRKAILKAIGRKRVRR